MRRRVVIAWLSAAGALGNANAIVACGSVPDVTFVDGGPDAPTSSTGTSPPPPPPPGDAGPDTSSGCPDTAPAGAICCGSTVCMGCTQARCTDCISQACQDGQICCPAGPGKGTSCKPEGSCN